LSWKPPGQQLLDGVWRLSNRLANRRLGGTPIQRAKPQCWQSALIFSSCLLAYWTRHEGRLNGLPPLGFLLWESNNFRCFIGFDGLTSDLRRGGAFHRDEARSLQSPAARAPALQFTPLLHRDIPMHFAVDGDGFVLISPRISAFSPTWSAEKRFRLLLAVRCQVRLNLMEPLISRRRREVLAGDGSRSSAIDCVGDCGFGLT